MCKSKFQPSSLKGWPISDLYTELGETKVIDSVLRPREDERELLSQLFDPEEEDDIIDIVVDSWNKRLKEGRRVWFRDLCRDDINGRKDVVKPMLESSTPNETANDQRAASGSLSMELKEVMDIMADGLKQFKEKVDEIVKRVDDMDGRLQMVEDLTIQLSSCLGRQPIIIPPAPTMDPPPAPTMDPPPAPTMDPPPAPTMDPPPAPTMDPPPAPTMDPPPAHTDNTSETETKERKRKRKRAETKKKGGKEVIEDVTKEDGGEPSEKEAGEIKEPEKNKKRQKKTHSSTKKHPYVPRVTRAQKARDGDGLDA